MFCAAIPAAGALGAKLNVDRKRKVRAGEKLLEKPVAVTTIGIIICLLCCSIVYHTTFFDV